MRAILLILALVVVPVTRADDAADKVADRFLVLTGRNIFNAARRPAAPGRATGTPAPPRTSATLVGVVILDGTATAVFLGTTADWTGARLSGAQLGTCTVTAIDTAGATLRAADQTYHLTVGAALQQAADGTWTVTADSRPVSSAAVAGPVVAGPAAAGPAAEPATPPLTTAEPGDILKRLRERRQQETNR